MLGVAQIGEWFFPRGQVFLQINEAWEQTIISWDLPHNNYCGWQELQLGSELVLFNSEIPDFSFVFCSFAKWTITGVMYSHFTS